MGIFLARELESNRSQDLSESSTQGLDLLLVLVRARRQIIATAFCFLAIGTMIAFLLKPTFTAKATILPPQAPQSAAAALMGQLGSLGSLGGAGGFLKTPADTYVGMLQSRTIADQVIDKFHLQSLWKLSKLEDARKALKSHVQVESAKDGLIVITADDPDPKLASDLANAFVDELYHMNASLAVTEAGQRRLFFDQQLLDERNALTHAENDLKAIQEKTGIITLAGQSEMAIRSIAEMRAEITSREVELQAIRAYGTDENPDVFRVQREIDALRKELANRENAQQSMAMGDTEIPAGRVPAKGLEYARKLREVKYHETLFELLSRQYAAARIDEAKSAPVIQVIDRAVPPDRKSGPPRMLLMIGFGIFGFCIGCLWAFFRQTLERMRLIPESATKLDQLRSMLHVRL
jgi:tyrosine-protein kinase Etk/Wzc